MSSFFMWLSRSCTDSKASYDCARTPQKNWMCKTRNVSSIDLIRTWSSKHVCALPETRSDTWEELQVVISQRMVTIPRGKDAASRGGGEALPH
jgi:hypothetical protein